jgi:Tfp pilus assembly protein PilV
MKFLPLLLIVLLASCRYEINGAIFTKQNDCLEHVQTLQTTEARGLLAAADKLCSTNHSLTKFSGNAKCIENKARRGYEVQMECKWP